MIFPHQPLALARVLEAFRPGRRADSGSTFSSAGTDAGGCPAATYFLCFAKESKQRKATPGSSALRASLRCSQTRAAAELGLVVVSRKWFSLCSPSDSPRGHPPRLLRCSAPLMGPPASLRRPRINPVIPAKAGIQVRQRKSRTRPTRARQW